MGPRDELQRSPSLAAGGAAVPRAALCLLLGIFTSSLFLLQHQRTGEAEGGVSAQSFGGTQEWQAYLEGQGACCGQGLGAGPRREALWGIWPAGATVILILCVLAFLLSGLPSSVP